MTQLKSSRRIRLFLNWLIRRFNRYLPVTEIIPEVPLIPFSRSSKLEAVVWTYYNLIQDEYADWRDNNSIRATEIAEEIAELRQKHGKKLLEYLTPYKDFEPKDATYFERHWVRVAYDLFHSTFRAVQNK